MNYPYSITICLAGVYISLDLHYESGLRLLEQFAIQNKDGEIHLKLDEEDWNFLKIQGYPQNGQIEVSYLTSYCSDYLMNKNRCIIHAAAFSDQKTAWIIAAGPGVGKSTQIKTLQELFPEKYNVICGDRPVLEICEKGDIMVHPSPWNGKEGWHGAEPAPLAGIICLSRGEENKVELLKAKDSVCRVFQSIIQTGKDENVLKQSASVLTKILKKVPVWDFINQDIPESTKLLYETVLRKEAYS